VSVVRDDGAACKINVQFVDDDRIDRMFWDVPLKFLPRPGDHLNILKDDFAYFLIIEDVTHIVEYDRDSDPSHSVTVTANCEKIRARNN
jgi:hypothetical protein